MWYMDCFCYGAVCGIEFPVNSYYSEELECLLAGASRMLSNESTGIDEIRISRETKGQSPQPMYFPPPVESELSEPCQE